MYSAIVLKPSALKAFTVILFAFCNHFTMLAIVPSFKDPTPRRRTLLVLISSSVILIFYVFVSLFGYLHFGNSVDENILLANSSKIYAVAQLVVAVVILVSYPLLCAPTKSCVDFLLCKRFGSATGKYIHIRNISITAGLVLSSALVAMVSANDVLDILGLFSAFCGSLLMYIFPALYFLRLGHSIKGQYPISKTERVVAYVDIALGTVVLIFGTFFNAQDLYHKHFGK